MRCVRLLVNTLQDRAGIDAMERAKSPDDTLDFFPVRERAQASLLQCHDGIDGRAKPQRELARCHGEREAHVADERSKAFVMAGCPFGHRRDVHRSRVPRRTTPLRNPRRIRVVGFLEDRTQVTRFRYAGAQTLPRGSVRRSPEVEARPLIRNPKRRLCGTRQRHPHDVGPHLRPTVWRARAVFVKGLSRREQKWVAENRCNKS